ncbi:C-type lectin domain family 4 member M [Merluccius polli]|uniref:C-type lectin domain family 4 member M n=1 Tax=Merluccius polli TaxID=89951 RepID=A0AA47P1E4_MERPO|nr:C-type lectin domain family 4 member M [Merluccius polli]
MKAGEAVQRGTMASIHELDSGLPVQRGTMASIHELDSGLPEEQENLSLDARATRKRRSACRLSTDRVVDLEKLRSSVLVNGDSLDRMKGPIEIQYLFFQLVKISGEFTRLGWLYYDHRLYYISTAKKNWTASRDDCLERDADLVVINSREEQEFVSSLAGYQWFWIGLSDGDPEGTWKWVDGTNMTSSFWGRGQPTDAGGGDDCVATSLGKDWHNGWCADQYRWICEKVLVLDHLEAELNKEVMREEVPQIYDTPFSMTVSVGNTASFSCRARGRPQPTVQWLLDGRLLETDGTDNRPESVVRMDGENLILRGVRSGVETVLCMATNSAGTANHTAWLLVYEVRPDGWLHFDHSLYYISTAEKNWTASRDDCLERDADLVVINSREEQLCCHDNRYNYYLKQEFVGRQAGNHWIGLSDGDTEGTWKWVDGTNMTSSFWLSGEPNDGGGVEDCVGTWGYGWNDGPCTYQRHWICEKV